MDFFKIFLNKVDTPGGYMRSNLERLPIIFFI